MKDFFDDMIQWFMIILFLIFASRSINEAPPPSLSEALKVMQNFAPIMILFIVGSILIIAIQKLLDVDPLETVITTDMTFWEWGQRGYILFALSVIIVTTILNKPLGTVASVIFFVISIHRLIQKFGNEKKERR